jgi:hypothetical protein
MHSEGELEHCRLSILNMDPVAWQELSYLSGLLVGSTKMLTLQQTGQKSCVEEEDRIRVQVGALVGSWPTQPPEVGQDLGNFLSCRMYENMCR